LTLEHLGVLCRKQLFDVNWDTIGNISDNNKKVEVIRKLVDDIRFEDDKSGLYFVYENTTCVAFPT
jgi:hypothetical protein